MPYEGPQNYINGLDSSYPTGSDPINQGDDHIRMIKNVLKTTFPNLTGAMTASHTELNALDGFTGSTADLNMLSGVPDASQAEMEAGTESGRRWMSPLRIAQAIAALVPTSFASGTKMLFQQTSAPTGWTKDTTHNDKALRIVSGTVGTGGTVAFTTAFASQAVSGSVGNTTLSLAQMPTHAHTGSAVSNGAHTHTTTVNLGASGSIGGYMRADNLSQPAITSSSNGAHTHTLSLNNSGSSSSHTHSFTGTAIDMAVQYVDTIIATKD